MRKSTPYSKRRFYRCRNWCYLLDEEDRTAWIVRGHIGRSKRFRIPECVEFEGQCYVITSIEPGAFNNPRTLRHLVIPDRIKYVDDDEFIFLPKLRSIYIGKGIEHLTDWHFRRSGSPVPLSIDKGNPNLMPSDNLILTGDGKTVLRTMKRCRNYIIPEGVERIYACALWENTILEEVILPGTLKTVGDNGLSNNPGLKRITFPEGFETFDVQGLMDCTRLEYLDLPSTLRKLTNSLSGCSGLKTLIIRTDHVFDGPVDLDDIPADCRIQVPDHLIGEYKRHPAWKRFHIEGITK